MIPLRDTIQARNYPVINLSIIALNVIIFIWQLSQGPGQERIFFLYGLVPTRYSSPIMASYFTLSQQIIPFFTSIFLHGGFFHLIMNMWFLHIFGDNVEDRLGSIRYLLFYLLCGIAAGFVHLITNWHSQVPTIGASGAIAGVMGAYMILYPKARILTLIPIFLFIQLVELPAYFFLGFWFFMQFFSATLSGGQAGGIAWWAHIGGFLGGIFILKGLTSLPRTGIGQKLRRYGQKRSTPRLQRVEAQPTTGDLDLYGTILISAREAFFGARKVVNVPHGTFQKTIILTIPPGTRDGTQLRLVGLGQRGKDGTRGNLYLKVIVED